jgi:threonine aldolase
MAARPVVDLRSDTVTKPSPAMRAAIAAAEVGDDVLGHDPTVEKLERRVAEILGKEAALFVPSGTMANQISVRAHCPPGGEVVVERGSHVLNFEAGAAAALSGVAFFALDGTRGIFEPDAVRRAIHPAFPTVRRPRSCGRRTRTTSPEGASGRRTRWTRSPASPTKRVSRSISTARGSGTPPSRRVVTGAHRARRGLGVGLHVEGLGAPVGSLVVGAKKFIEGCWVHRKRMGGGMRQSGILAAAGLFGLDHHQSRLAEDHANARFLGERLAALPGVRVDLEATQTNIVVFDVAGTGRTPGELATQAASRDVLVVPFGATTLRAVTHLDVDRSGVERAADVLAEILATSAARAGS